MLQLTAIQKSFGSHQVFSIDELHLPNGIYWLKGANGSGKSTLMKLIAGLLPFKGEILLNQLISIHQQPVDYRALVNHSAAEPIYPSFLTGNELVEFIGAVKKGTTQQIKEVKEILNIDNYLANPTGSYSSGMLKKLSLLTAFMGKPAWILLDEPFTTLDHASQSALCKLIRQKHGEGISFMITSHHDIETTDIPFDKVFTLADKRLHETIPG
jgi:ABC-2 type transport system ATP-binding protein